MMEEQEIAKEETYSRLIEERNGLSKRNKTWLKEKNKLQKQKRAIEEKLQKGEAEISERRNKVEELDNTYTACESKIAEDKKRAEEEDQAYYQEQVKREAELRKIQQEIEEKRKAKDAINEEDEL